MSLYKTSRCKFFTSQGKPLEPFCSRGSACRYLHPDDDKWQSAKNDYSRFYSKSKPHTLYNAPRASRMRTLSADRHTPRPAPRSSPLVPQSDLFKLNVEEDTSNLSDEIALERDYIRQQRPEHFVGTSKSRTDLPVKSEIIAGSNASRFHMSRSMDFSSNAERRNTEREIDRGNEPVEIVSRARETTSNGQFSGTRTPIAPRVRKLLTHGKPTRFIGEVFKRLACSSNQAVQNTAEYENEDKKLQTYTELSTTLAKISPSAATAVAPTLASITTSRMQCKERMDSDLQLVEHAWEEIFDTFAHEISAVIEVNLQNALTTLTKEGEKNVQTVIESGSSMKRKLEAMTSEMRDVRRERRYSSREPSLRTHDDKGDRDSHKRKRPRQSSVSENPEKDGSLVNLLQDMKMVMARQTQALEALAEENSRLKIRGSLTGSSDAASFGHSAASDPGSSNRFSIAPGHEHNISAAVDNSSGNNF